MDEFNVEWDLWTTNPLSPHAFEFSKYVICFVTNGEKCGIIQSRYLCKWFEIQRLLLQNTEIITFTAFIIRYALLRKL